MDKFQELLNRIFFEGEGGGGGAGTPPKLYNTDELNGIIGSRLAQERTKIYKLLGVEDEDGLKNVATQLKSYTEENAKLKAENEKYVSEKTLTEKKAKLTEAGIDPDFMDVAINKWDGKQDLAKFVEANPKLTAKYFENGGKGEDFKGTGGSMGEKGGAGKVDLSKLTTEEFMKLAKDGKI
jgi:hypothetical protein